MSFKLFYELFYDEMTIIFRFITKTLGMQLGILYFKLHMLCAAPLYLKVSKQRSLTKWYFLSSVYLSSNFFLPVWQFSWTAFDSKSFFVNIIFSPFQNWLLTFYALLKFFIQSSLLYPLCLFSVLENLHSADIEQPQRIFSPCFVVNDFLGLFLRLPIFLITNSRSA